MSHPRRKNPNSKNYSSKKHPNDYLIKSIAVHKCK